jgi:hypothetical protein
MKFHKCDACLGGDATQPPTKCKNYRKTLSTNRRSCPGPCTLRVKHGRKIGGHCRNRQWCKQNTKRWYKTLVHKIERKADHAYEKLFDGLEANYAIEYSMEAECPDKDLTTKRSMIMNDYYWW